MTNILGCRLKHVSITCQHIKILFDDYLALSNKHVKHRNYLLLWLFIVSFNAGAMSNINSNRHVDVLPLSIAHKINLEQAIDMALKTTLGQQFKADIAELAKQGKIRLTDLDEMHYGESGEGCIIRDGQYFYEGFFIILNEKQTIPELASSLMHEVEHYRHIKRVINKTPKISVKIGELEISAFAAQWDFIQELERLQLSDRNSLFIKGGKIVFDVMTTAHATRKNPSKQAYITAIEKMVTFGYPPQELERTLLLRDSAHCQESVFINNAAK